MLANQSADTRRPHAVSVSGGRTPLDIEPRSAGPVLGFVVAATAGLWNAWTRRFVQDDAYISFRYAAHLADGLGLVWNPGERIEGYTNFLWTLLMAIPHAAGLPVEGFAVVLGLLLFTGTLAIVYALVAALTRSWPAAACAALMLGLFPSSAAYATGGLETQLQTCLLTGLLALIVVALRHTEPPPLVAIAIGTTAALAVLTRMDSIAVVAPLMLLAGWFVVADEGWRGLRAFAPAIAVPIAICSAWLGWKLAYYGALLPNTYYAKVEAPGRLAREGLRFVRTFVQVYAFYLPILCVPAALWLARAARIDRRVLAIVATPVVIWLLYVVMVGGDFMEYRFLVPVLPIVFVGIYWIACALDGTPARAALLASIVIGAGIWHDASARTPRPEPPLSMKDLVIRPGDEWFEIGEVLGRAFAGGVQPSIAVVPAGVIPYLSRLPAVDMMGLTDRDVRSFRYLPDELIGHRRLAPLALLEGRRINFLIGHPLVLPRRSGSTRYRFADFAKRPFADPDDERLRGRSLIEVPLARDRVMLMLYLTETRAATARLDALGWRRYPLE